MADKDSKRQSKAYWTAMATTRGFGAQTFALLRQLGIERQLPMSSAELQALGFQAPPKTLERLSQLSCEKGEEQLELHMRRGIEVLDWDCSEYPPELRASRHALPALFVLGKWPSPGHYPLAMVGTRTPGPWAPALCRLFMEAMGNTRTAIISGLAQGIDSLCHREALNLRLPTIAVLGQGLGQSLGGSREQLAHTIVEQNGCLASPFPLDAPAHPAYFVQRNRIIAGLSRATLLVESREDGGAMHTARFCLEDQRLLLAVPGDPWRDTAQGGNSLIRSGAATALWKPIDLPGMLGITERCSEKCSVAHKLPAEWARFGGTSISLHELQHRTGKPFHELLAILTQLEIQGCCSVQDGHWIHFI